LILDRVFEVEVALANTLAIVAQVGNIFAFEHLGVLRELAMEIFEVVEEGDLMSENLVGVSGRGR
jgi:hypothetical protein